ncbi:MAG: hypothetical protein Q4E75_06370 [bacterium]|nr:hypothetical protein [bacterium]
MKLLLSHIADLDGISPVILMKLIDEDFEYKLFEVNDLSSFIDEKINTNYFDKYEKIFITDLGIKKEVALKIINSKYKDKFLLFDHHQSHYYLNDYEFAKVEEEKDGFKECGTTIFYEYLVNNYDNKILRKESVITYVELVRENDTWQFTDFKEDAKNLNALFSFYGIEDFIDIYTTFLKGSNKFYFNENELFILKSLNNQMNNYLESMKDKVIFKKINGYNIGIVFAELYRSDLGNYLAEIYKDKIDFVCIINLSRHISLRGIKIDKPVNKFAEIYGGGGHPLASAIPFKDNLKELIIESIFYENK